MDTLTSLKATGGVNNRDILEEVALANTIKDLFLLIHRYGVIDTFIAMIEFEKIQAIKKQEIEEILEIKVGEVRAVSSFMEEDNISTLSKNSNIIARYEWVTSQVETDKLIGVIKLNIKHILLKLSKQLPQDLSGLFSGSKEEIQGKLLQYILNNKELFSNDKTLDDEFDDQFEIIKRLFKKNLL